MKKIGLFAFCWFNFCFLSGQVSGILLDSACNQYNRFLPTLKSYSSYPRSINVDQSLKLVSASDWTSGFFPGTLWYLFEYSKNEKFKLEAEKFIVSLASQKNNTGTHDLGFMLYCSYGNAYRITEDPAYKDVLLTAAKSLSSRYNKNVGCIRSWDFGKWSFPVIIDNMMNLELLFWATRVTGDSSYYKIAHSHALTTLKNHFRNDHSSYHVVDYDPTTGSVISKGTWQGLSAESSWSRGQAWGLYGFTMVYRETGDTQFLIQARNIASYIAKNLPADLVPYWDFDDPKIPDAPRDASAAAITASALIELSQLSDKNKQQYLDLAKGIIQSLGSTQYFNKPNENKNFLLKHSTGSKPGNSEVDVPLIYADYYYVESLLRLGTLNTGMGTKGECLEKISIFPNPSSGMVFYNAGTDVDNIRLYTLQGSLIKHFKPAMGIIDLKDVPQGTYLIEFISKNKRIAIRKIVRN